MRPGRRGSPQRPRNSRGSKTYRISPADLLRLFSSRPWLAGVTGTFVSVAMTTLCLVVLYEGRAQALAHATEAAQNLASVISSDIARNIELCNLSLEAIVDGAQQPQVMTLPVRVRNLVLFDRATTAKYLGGAYVMDRNGQIIAAGDGRAHTSGAFGDREYFAAQEHAPGTGLFISHPYVSRLRDGAPSIALSRRINAADGSFNGIAVLALRIEYFQALLDKVNTDRRGSAFVIMRDGTLLARKPPGLSVAGEKLGTSPTFSIMASHDSGTYTTVSRVDGVRRIYTFLHIPGTPLIVAVAPAEDDVLQPWRDRSAVLGIMTLLFGATFAAVSWLLAFALRDRATAHAALARLAVTDPLTGLGNRRVLDTRLDAEWRRARRDGAPLSVLFVDVDHFKKFNDLYGHASGDDALALVAECIGSVLNRPDDTAVRYGGEEFVVLLPGTMPNGAAHIGELLRARVESMQMPHGGSEFGVVSVSVGFSTAYAGSGTGDAYTLLRAADNALYAAKCNGRNQVHAGAHSATPLDDTVEN